MDIQHDVIEECNKHGGVVHIYIDKNSAEVRVTSDPTVSKAGPSTLYSRLTGFHFISVLFEFNIQLVS